MFHDVPCESSECTTFLPSIFFIRIVSYTAPSPFSSLISVRREGRWDPNHQLFDTNVSRRTVQPLSDSVLVPNGKAPNGRLRAPTELRARDRRTNETYRDGASEGPSEGRIDRMRRKKDEGRLPLWEEYTLEVLPPLVAFPFWSGDGPKPLAAPSPTPQLSS